MVTPSYAYDASTVFGTSAMTWGSFHSWRLLPEKISHEMVQSLYYRQPTKLMSKLAAEILLYLSSAMHTIRNAFNVLSHLLHLHIRRIKLKNLSVLMLFPPSFPAP